MIHLEIALLSGASAKVVVDLDSTVLDLKQRVQQELQLGISDLVADGQILDPGSTLRHSKLVKGQIITATARRARLVSGFHLDAFALIKSDGGVVTWGHPTRGGNSSKVQSQLFDVRQIVGSSGSFAALRGDGTVVTWGDVSCGGNSQECQLQGMRGLCPAFFSIAAFSESQVVVWGSDNTGAPVLQRVKLPRLAASAKALKASSLAWALVKADGKLRVWGNAQAGGDCQAVKDQLYDIQEVSATMYAFAALRADGHVITWGDAERGGDSSAVQSQLQEVCSVTASAGAFAALRRDGAVVTWGQATCGGHSQVAGELWGVESIEASPNAFAALRADGAIVSWGRENSMMNTVVDASVAGEVQLIRSSSGAFAALRADGSLHAWGNGRKGGQLPARVAALRNVVDVCGSKSVFAALLSDGKVVTWGEGRACDTSDVQDQLKETLRKRPCSEMA